MPWEAKQVNGNWCSVNKETGKSVSCFGSDGKAKAEAHVKALYANTTEDLSEGAGPTIIRVALTNEPHLRLRSYPISVVEVEGQEYFRIPTIPAGNYKHPKQDLNLNTFPITDKRNKLNRIVANHYSPELTDAGQYVRPGHNRDQAWAWFSTEHGGWMAIEDNVVVIYARPTGEEFVNLVKSGRYRYASADLHLNYRSNKVLEGSDEIINWEEVSEREDSMAEDKVTLSQADYTALVEAKTSLSTAEAEVNQLKEENKKLKLQLSKVQADDNVDLPPEVVAKLEEADNKLKQATLRLQEAEITSVKRDLQRAMKYATQPNEDGIVPAFLIELAEKINKNEAVGEEADGLIKLESEASPVDFRLWQMNFMRYMLENAPRISSSASDGEDGDRAGGKDGVGPFKLTETELGDVDALLEGAHKSAGMGVV